MGSSGGQVAGKSRGTLCHELNVTRAARDVLAEAEAEAEAKAEAEAEVEAITGSEEE